MMITIIDQILIIFWSNFKILGPLSCWN